MQPGPANHTAPGQLADLRKQFPGFRIWREMTGERSRYLARSARPHTVVTGDLGELRTALSGGLQ
jgi:hypothetical protein